MRANFKIDTHKLKAAVRQLAAVGGSKPVQQVMRGAAAQVVKRAVSVTPPAKGDMNKDARVRGEAVIVSDLLKIAVPTEIDGAPKKGRGKNGRFTEKSDLLSDYAQLLGVYTAARSRQDGRVNPRNRKQRLHVSQADFIKLAKMAQRDVGMLAAGWNAAAERLGVKMPAWIRRHGTKFGVIEISVTKAGVRIYLANKVGFVDNIPDLQRRLQWAVDVVAKSIIERQIPNAIKSVARRAGFRSR